MPHHPQLNRRMLERDIERAERKHWEEVKEATSEVVRLLRHGPLLEILEDRVADLKQMRALGPDEIIAAVSESPETVTVYADPIVEEDQKILAAATTLHQLLQRNVSQELTERAEAMLENAYDDPST